MVSDIPDGVSNDLGNIHVTVSSNFARNKGKTSSDESLTGDPASLVLCDDGIKNRVLNGVGDFVRVSLGHRLRGEYEILLHGIPPSLIF